MTPALRILALFGIILGCFACGGSKDDSASSDDEVRAAQDSEYLYVAPPLTAGSHTWQTVVMQNTGGFEGTLAFRSSTPDGEPDQLVAIDRKTNAISFLSAETMAPTDDWETSRKELDDASNQFTVMAGDFESGGTRFAAFVNDHNKCFIKEAAIALALVGAIIAAPFVIEAGAAAIAGGIATAQEAGAAIAANGLRTFAIQAAKTAATNPAVQKYVAYHVAKTAVKGWLLFSDKGKELTHSVMEQAKEVWNAKCELPNPGALDGMMIMSKPY